jgi:hypothetical protein
MRKNPVGSSIDSDIDSFGTLNKKNLRAANPAVVPPAPPKPQPRVSTKQAMTTFNNANDFLKRYQTPATPAAKPKAVKAPAPMPVVKPTAVKKAGRGR